MSAATKRDLLTPWIEDLLSDAAFAEKQAVEGPFYPDRGVTPDGLRAYAAKCRADAASASDATLAAFLKR